MNLDQYKIESARTCPDLGSSAQNVLHMNIGMHTEIGELLDVLKRKIAYGKEMDIVNIGEELADCEWYNTNKLRILDKERGVAAQKFKFTSIEVIANTLLELDLKHETAAVMTMTLKAIAEFFELDYEKLLDNNIAKLKIRFPNKFTSENALNRDLKSERVELEK